MIEAKKEAGNIALSKLEQNFLIQTLFVKKMKDNPTANLTMPDGKGSPCTFSHVSAPVTTDDNEPAGVTELVSIVTTSESPCLGTY